MTQDKADRVLTHTLGIALMRVAKRIDLSKDELRALGAYHQWCVRHQDYGSDVSLEKIR